MAKKKTENHENDIKEPKPPRQSVITKGITRTIQTAKYFSLVIQHTAQDTIEWHDLEERERKQQSLTQLVINNFATTHDSVLQHFGLGEEHVFGTDHVAEKNADKSPLKHLGLHDLKEYEELK